MNSDDDVWGYVQTGILVVVSVLGIIAWFVYASDACERMGGHMSYLNMYGKTVCVDHDGKAIVP